MKRILIFNSVIICIATLFLLISLNISREFSFSNSEDQIENISLINQNSENYCTFSSVFFEKGDDAFCFQPPLLTEERGVVINLSLSKVFLYDQNKLLYVLPLTYQSPENKWFVSPTGFYRIKTREKLHWSTIALAWMPYSMQYYENFFLHGIPYYPNGKKITSTVSGGCLRFQDEIAKQIYDFVKIKDQVLVYADFSNLKVKDDFSPPMNTDDVFILKRYYTPLRIFRRFSGDRKNLIYDYYNHTGVDLRLKPLAKNNKVYSIYEGKIVKIIKQEANTNNNFGNTVIIEHNINGQILYSLYARLTNIRNDLLEGNVIHSGEVIGFLGNNPFELKHPEEEYLHFEIKISPVLENPKSGKICLNSDQKYDFCYGNAPAPLENLGYFNPIDFLFTKINS